jgi:hypothetical protein
VAKPGYLRYALTHGWRFLFIIIEVRPRMFDLFTEMLKGLLDLPLCVSREFLVVLGAEIFTFYPS